jgi:hypothetical protein
MHTLQTSPRGCGFPIVHESSAHTQHSVPDFSSGVIFKLMSFTFAMITLPIGTYFFTNAYVFNGKHRILVLGHFG